MSFLLGVSLIAVGVLIIKKSEWFYKNFGPITWAEIHLGTAGGSRLMYKLLGICLLFLGLLGATGLLESFIAILVSPLTKFNK